MFCKDCNDIACDECGKCSCPEWIDIKDRPPDNNSYVLIYTIKNDLDFCGYFVVLYKDGLFYDWPHNCGCTGFADVKYWMNLPVPPVIK